MARYSTPATRAQARDKAEVIGQAERIIKAEIEDRFRRMLNSPVAPALVAVVFFGFIFLAHWVVGQVNL